MCTHEFLHASFVDEDGHGDAKDGEETEVLGRKPEAPLDHLAREAVGLDERVGLDVSGGAWAGHLCVAVTEEGKKSGREAVS